MVTSHGVGMAVPDWPNTFGYNMFFFPFSQWVGGVFYEHTHRLIASATGLCTTILAVWLYGKSARPFLRWSGVVLLAGSVVSGVARPAHWADALVGALSGLSALVASFVWPRCAPAAPWLKRLGLVAFFGVVLQGVLGGLRVVLFRDQIGIFHATLAQLFFCLICALALFTSRWWEKRFGSAWAIPGDSKAAEETRVPVHALTSSRRLAWLCLGATSLILGQLILGATMRHQHAGLSIPDFPLAYGKLWPAMDTESVVRYNQHRIEVVDLNPITAFQIALQMAHRLAALLIVGAISASAWVARRQGAGKSTAGRLISAWLALILIQAALGAATIWSNKAADVATTHVLVGALSLSLGCSLSIILLKERRRQTQLSVAFSPAQEQRSGSFAPRAATALGLD